MMGVVAGWLAVSGAVAGEAVGVEELLGRLAARAPKWGVRAEFREERKLAMLREPVRASGWLEYLAPGYFRKSVTGPVRSETVFDGERLWVVFPDEGVAEVYSGRAQRAVVDSLAGVAAVWAPGDLMRRFEAECTREGEGYVLRLRPRSRSLRRALERVVLRLSGELRLVEVVLEGPDKSFSRIEILSERDVRLESRDFAVNPEAKGWRVVEPLGRGR